MSGARVSARPDADVTFPQLLRQNAETHGTAPAYREKWRGLWRTLSWQEFAAEAETLAVALAGRGLAPGGRVALIGENRPRLFSAMAAVHALGAVAVPLFPDATVEEIEGQLREAEVTHAFAENQEQVDKLLEVLPRCPALGTVAFDDARSMGHYRAEVLVRHDVLLEEGRAAGEAAAAKVRAGAGSVAADSPAFLFYTSGASGPSKGVVMTHGALIGQATEAARIEGLGPEDTTIAYLPPGWIAQALFSYVQPMAVGCSVCCPESSDTLLSDMREVAPTVFLTTPRMLDTLVSQVSLRMEDTGGIALALYRDAAALAQRLGRLEHLGESAGTGDRLRAGLYEALVYGPLRDALGMNRVRVAYSSADAVDPSVLSFFRTLGVNLKQLYGSTETGFMVAFHRDGAVRPDTVGTPLEGTEVAISGEGEILVRSPGLFKEYLGDPAATEAAFDAEGRFRTGDLGRLGEDGQLRVLDRAADVCSLADGTVLMPRRVENRIKASPYVREAIVVGEGRDYVAALVDINTESVGRWADDHALPYSGHADLASQDMVYDLVAGILAGVNAALAGDPELAPCRIRRFALLREELGADSGVLTRTGKIRRAVAAERFAPVIEALYAGRHTVSLPGAAGEGATRIKLLDVRASAMPEGRAA